VKKFHVGRPRATSKLVDRNIVRFSRAHPKMTYADILREISIPAGLNQSKYTVERPLRTTGLLGRHLVKKPIISEKNRKDRVAWDKAYIN
jgi:hypothetical protein